MELLETSAVLDIPADVAVCPYCGKKLWAQFSAWEELADGSWVASSVEVECEGEPDLEVDTDAFVEWRTQHTYMPYVYWLPIDLTVTEWVNKRYRFKVE